MSKSIVYGQYVNFGIAYFTLFFISKEIIDFAHKYNLRIIFTMSNFKS